MTTEIKHRKEVTDEQKEKTKIYLNEWRQKNKDKVASYQKTQYIKNLEADPNYRNTLKELSKTRRLKMQIENPPKANGRPRIHEIKPTSHIIGRPRKYNITAQETITL